jgi:TorA maturation chaperone TorD
VIIYDSSMEQRWDASAFGYEPQWAEAAETADALEKADAVEMAKKADAAVEKGDALETLASNLEARCIPLAI